jgi:hypothetical protein
MADVKGKNLTTVSLPDALLVTVNQVMQAQELYKGVVRGQSIAKGNTSLRLVTAYSEGLTNGVRVASVTLALPITTSDADDGYTVSADATFDDAP